MDEAIKRFKDSMKSLNNKDVEIVSKNLHKNNMRIDRDIRFSLLRESQPTKRKLYF